MIKLYGSGPYFGLPDASPFVTKAEMLLKLAKLPYETAKMSFRKAPKSKIPYIEDDGLILGDSTFIRFHIEKKYGVDFNAGYGARELGAAWAAEKMVEDHLYWIAVSDRWLNLANFERGPAAFFLRAPAPVRPFVKSMVRRQICKALHGQGMGRHTEAERAELGRRGIDAVAAIMGSNPYVLGDRPCGADATVYAFLLGAMCPLFESEIRRHAEAQPHLVAYVKRMTAEFYPSHKQ